MIPYTSISEAWGIDINNEKEMFKNNIEIESESKSKKNKKKSIKKNKKKDLKKKISPDELCKMILSCDECLERIEKIINKTNHKKKEPKINAILVRCAKYVNYLLNKNKQLTILVLLFFILIIFILLIHSYRDPVKINGVDKNIYVFPEDMSKLKKYIKES